MNLLIEHFKCFSSIDIYLNDITILAGANGNGKSTCIQALLYLRQTVELNGELSEDQKHYLFNGKAKNIPLNGQYNLSLGNSSSILNKASGGNPVIGLHSEGQEFTVTYEADELEPQLWLTAKQADIISNSGLGFPISNIEFYYLSAERLGPRIRNNLKFTIFPNAGYQGEFTAQLLDRDKGYWKIDDTRKFGDGGSNFLIDQTNLWLDYIMPGVKVRVATDTQTLSSQILIENAYTINDPIIAPNIGFGISYVLPIIVTGLIAEKNSFFIIENPEAHLHPSAQTKIARFLAMVCKSEVKVIVETHSDHFINGLQLAVASGFINHDSVTINYLNHDNENIQPELQPIVLNEKGELSAWPKGFFDQAQRDYAELFRLRRHE